MPRYFRIAPSIWHEKWDDETRLLAFYLLTNPHRSTEGLYRLPLPYIQADTDWSPKRIEKAMVKLDESGFLRRADDIVLILNALKYQAPQNTNGVKAALTALETVPESPLDAEFGRLAQRFSQRLWEGLQERFPQRFGDPLALAPSLALPHPLSDDDELIIKTEELRGPLMALGFNLDDIDGALVKYVNRVRFGEPIKDPMAWLPHVCRTFEAARVDAERRSEPVRVVIDGETWVTTKDGEWQVEAAS